jgi:hypothetical protein
MAKIPLIVFTFIVVAAAAFYGGYWYKSSEAGPALGTSAPNPLAGTQQAGAATVTNGLVESVSASNITLHMPDGSVKTFSIGPAARVSAVPEPKQLSDISVGDMVSVYGYSESDKPIFQILIQKHATQ